YPTGTLGVAGLTPRITLALGGETTATQIGPFVLQRSLTGFDGFGLFKVTVATPGSPWTVGETLGLDLHLFDVHPLVGDTGGIKGVFGADVKGDLAPVVPEPASLSLLAFGFAGLVVRRR